MGRTSGTWGPGQGGKPKGAKDKHPRSARAAVNKLLDDFGNDVQLIGEVLKRGLTARAPSSFPYLKLVIEHHVGQPEQVVTVDLTKKAIDELHPGPGKTA